YRMSRGSPENHRAFVQRNIMTKLFRDTDAVMSISSTTSEKRFLRISPRNINHRSAARKKLHANATALWRGA
ncbi:hypothetical protein ABTN17_20690, partial [Acinetobacter baumannii]